MELKVNLTEDKVDNTVEERVSIAEQKKKDSEFEPKWEEVWNTGFTRPTGTVKAGIFQMKNSEPEVERLHQVKRAIEDGTISSEVDNLVRFTKTHALRLHAKLMEIKRVEVIEKMIEDRPANYHTILTEDQLDGVVDLLDKEKEVAVDTETTGLTWEDVTVGMSITFPEADEHVYIPYGHEDKEGNILPEQLDRRYIHDTLKEPLERKGFRLIMFNGKFDVHMLYKDGVDTKDNLFFDPMIAMHVLNENEPRYALKELSNKYGKFFGYTDNSLSFDELFSKDPIDFIRSGLDIATIYACKDTELTYRMYKWQMEQFERLPDLGDMYFGIEQPITRIAIEMERNGMLLDLDFAKEYGKVLKKRITELEKIMYDNWGDLNTNSPLQLKEKLFVELGYEDISGTGSTNADVLKQLAREHDDVNALVEYRDINKLYTTYIDKLPELIQGDIPEYGVKGDGRLHGSFNQTGTVTGRFSSNDPNLQNIPREARPMFIAPEGKYILGMDYSQIEPRTFAHFTQDPDFMEPFIKGDDFYIQIAQSVYGIPYENALESDDTYWREHTDLPDHPRELAKLINLATMYGISAFSLSKTLGTTPEEAEEFIEDFYKTYPVMRAWMDSVVDQADEYGAVETMFKRKRRFPGHTEVAKRYNGIMEVAKRANGGEVPRNMWEAEIPYRIKRQYWDVANTYGRVERQSVNAVIQGSASDILKRAMIAVYHYMEEEHPDWKLLATIHDEILIEVPETVTIEEIEEVEKLLTTATELSVPINVDTEVMKRWGKSVPKEVWAANGFKLEEEEE